MTKAEFEDYVGRDDRIDKFVSICERYGHIVRYNVGIDVCTVDAVDPVTHKALVMHPYLHTLTFNVNDDEITMLTGMPFDNGIKCLESIFVSRNQQENDPSDFINDMRTL